MSTINNILEKINKIDNSKKTELAIHEVKLGITQDIEKIISELKEIPKALESSNKVLITHGKEYQDAFKRYTYSKDKAQTFLVKYANAYDRTGVLENKVKQSAAELGLNPSDIPNFNSLEKLHNELVKSYTTLKDTFSKQK